MDDLAAGVVLCGVIAACLCVCLLMSCMTRTQHDAYHLTLAALKSQAAFLMWWRIPQSTSILSIVAYNAWDQSTLVDFTSNMHVLYAWYAIQIAIVLCGIWQRRGDEAMASRLFAVAVFVVATRFNQKLPVSLVSSILCFHIVGILYDMARLFPQIAMLKWSSYVYWTVWRVYLYSQFATTSMLDALVFMLPLCAESSLLYSRIAFQI